MLRHVTAPSGVRLACEVSGEGPPLVLVHGAGSARWGFDLLRPLLEESFTVIAVDRRGRGGSADGRRYELEREFEDVAAVVRAARAGGEADGRAFLLGHSYGGLIAAGAAPLIEGLEKLVLYEPPMGGVLAAPDVVARWRELAERGAREQMVWEFLHEVGGYSEAEIDDLRGTPAWDGRLRVAHTVPRELEAEHVFRLDRRSLAGLAPPTLLLLGSRSPAWARRSTGAYAEALRDATVRRLEGHGHGAAVTGPELLASEIEGFLTARAEPDRPGARAGSIGP